MIHLRPVAAPDLPICRELRNKNRQWFYNPTFVTEQMHHAWFDAVKNRTDFLVITLADGTVVGTVSAIRRDAGTEIGNLTLDERHQGHGYMTEAIKSLTRQKGVYYATTLPHNVRSQRVFESAGFQRAGITPDGWVFLRLHVE